MGEVRVGLEEGVVVYFLGYRVRYYKVGFRSFGDILV